MIAQVYHVKNPLRIAEATTAYEVRERMSVAEWLGRSRIDIDSYPTLCHINGDTDGIMRAEYADTFIEEGDTVFFSVLPTGGNGGGSNVAIILAVIVLAIITWGVGAALAGPAASGVGAAGAAAVPSGVAGIGGAALGAGGTLTALGSAVQLGVFIGGSFLINRFLVPEVEGGGQEREDLFTLGATGNIARKGNPVTVLYGRDTFPPDYIEPPWADFKGQRAIPDTTNARNRPEHFIHEVFLVTQGEADVEAVFVNDTDVNGFDEVEYAVRQPGEKLELVPRTFWTNPNITSPILLRGPNEEISAGVPYLGQEYPASLSTSYAINPTNSVNDNGDGTSTIEVASGTPFTGLTLDGKQIYISDDIGTGDDGAAQGASTNYNAGGETTAYKHIQDGVKSDQLANPDKMRDIVSNTNNSVTVRPAFLGSDPATYSRTTPPSLGTIRMPEDAGPRHFHVRQEWTTPFDVCPPGETVRHIHVDITGSPLTRTNSRGKTHNFGVGIRVEYREVDDSGDPLSGTTGDWVGMWDNWTKWDRTTGTPQRGWIRGTSSNDGRRRSRQANIALWGTGGKLHPVALTFRKKVTQGRYQVRVKRTSKYESSPSFQNLVFLSGVRGELVGDDRIYPNWTVLEMVSKGTHQLNSSSGRQVRVQAVRKLRQYSRAHASSPNLPTDPIQTFEGTIRLRIHHPDHGLTLGRSVTLDSVSPPAGVGGIVRSRIQSFPRTMHAIIDKDHYEILAGAGINATSDDTGGGSTVGVTATASWSTVEPTTNPMWALADAAQNTVYGGSKPDSELDLTAFVDLAETALDRGDEFNGVFKQARSLRKAMGEIARSMRAKVVKPNGVITPIRDEPRTVRSALFTGRNIVPGSFTRVYSFTNNESPDGVDITFKNAATGLESSVKRTSMGGTLGSNPLETFNTEARVRVTRTGHRRKVGDLVDFSGATAVGGITADELNIRGTVSAVISADKFEYTSNGTATSSTTGGGSAVVAQGIPLRAARIQLLGVTDPEQAHREALYYAADHDLRRLAVKFTTELEGYLPVVGELIGVSYPMPNWGQAGDVVGNYGPNLHSNPTFDDDITGWAAIGSDTTFSHNASQNNGQVVDESGGSGSAKIEVAGTAQTQVGIRDVTAVTVFTQGTKYRSFIRVRGTATAIGKTFQLEIEERDGGVWQAQSESVITLDGTWQTIEVAHTILGATIDDVYILALMDGSQHAIGDVIYVDGAVTVRDDITLPEMIRCDQLLDWVQGPQLLGNPGFETDTSDWTAFSESTITRRTTITEDTSTNPLEVFNGEARVRVTHTDHDFTLSQVITVAGATATGGIAAVDLNITAVVSLIVDANTFEYISNGTATSSTNGGGASVTLTINAGLNRGVTQSGACLEVESTDNPMVSGWSYAQESVAATVFTKGTLYSASCWVKAERGNTAIGKKFYIIIRSEGGAQPLTDKQCIITLTDKWQYVECLGHMITETDRNNVRILLGIFGTPVTEFGDKFFIDSVTLKRHDSSVGYFVGLKSDDGSTVGAISAGRVQGHDNLIEFAGPLTITPEAEGGSRERTQFTFGIADVWAHDCVVLEVTPRSYDSIEITAEVENSDVHSADGATWVPPEDDSPQRDPDAPVVTNVTAHIYGPLNARRVLVAWSAAPGAQYYVVEQASGTADSRSIALLAGLVNNGPFSDTEEIREFSLPDVFPQGTAVFLTRQNSTSYANMTYTNHGLSVGDYFYIEGQLGGINGIPASELNGVHTVQAVVDANEIEFDTFTTPTTGGVQANLQDSAKIGFFLGAVGEIVGDQDTTTEYLDYDYTSGSEFGQYTTIAEVLTEGAGDTAGAYAISGGQADLATESAILGDNITDLSLDTALVLDGSDDTEDKTIRVRGVGRLFGPWVDATLTISTPDQRQPMFNEATGLVEDPLIPIGAVFKASAWLSGTDTSVTVCTLPDDAVVTKVRYWIQTGNSSGLIKLGTSGDDDAYGLGTSATVTGVGETAGGGWSGGAEIGKIQPDDTDVVGIVTTANTSLKCLFTVEYEIVPPVP